jgi:hypothetical protein
MVSQSPQYFAPSRQRDFESIRLVRGPFAVALDPVTLVALDPVMLVAAGSIFWSLGAECRGPAFSG